MNTEPTLVSILAKDVKPYHYGVWSIEGGEPFANCICTIRWSDDGKFLWFGLDSHSFYKAAPFDKIELVDFSNNKLWERSRQRHADWVLPPLPESAASVPLLVSPQSKSLTRYDHPYKWSSDGPECNLCGFVHEPNLEPTDDE
jgi:hypothetical protein